MSIEQVAQINNKLTLNCLENKQENAFSNAELIVQIFATLSAHFDADPADDEETESGTYSVEDFDYKGFGEETDANYSAGSNSEEKSLP
ncbi:hypothetical protein HK100_007002, partial [Physocladia obscura]